MKIHTFQLCVHVPENKIFRFGLFSETKTINRRERNNNKQIEHFKKSRYASQLFNQKSHIYNVCVCLDLLENHPYSFSLCVRIFQYHFSTLECAFLYNLLILHVHSTSLCFFSFSFSFSFAFQEMTSRNFTYLKLAHWILLTKIVLIDTCFIWFFFNLLYFFAFFPVFLELNSKFYITHCLFIYDDFALILYVAWPMCWLQMCQKQNQKNTNSRNTLH